MTWRVEIALSQISNLKSQNRGESAPGVVFFCIFVFIPFFRKHLSGCVYGEKCEHDGDGGRKWGDEDDCRDEISDAAVGGNVKPGTLNVNERVGERREWTVSNFSLHHENQAKTLFYSEQEWRHLRAL